MPDKDAAGGISEDPAGPAALIVIVDTCPMLDENWPGDGASPPAEGNFNFAAHAVGWVYQLDGAAKLMGDEFADELAAISGLNRSRDRRSAQLAPCDRQDVGADAIPAHRHSAVRTR